MIEGANETKLLNLLKQHQAVQKGGGKQAIDDRKVKWESVRDFFEAEAGIKATVEQIKNGQTPETGISTNRRTKLVQVGATETAH